MVTYVHTHIKNNNNTHTHTHTHTHIFIYDVAWRMWWDEMIHNLLHVLGQSKDTSGGEERFRISFMCREHAASADAAADSLRWRGVTRLTTFLTFGVVALHQARLPDLYVEGFVLLVLLVVDNPHLDGFTGEEQEEEEEEEERKRRKREKRRQKKSGKDRLETGNSRGNRKELCFWFPTCTWLRKPPTSSCR